MPDFGDPNLPKTWLEVDFPILPINALSALEGNDGKPICQMSKWWAQCRECVFRAMLIAAAMEAPRRKTTREAPSSPDESEAHNAVWGIYLLRQPPEGKKL